MGEPLRTFLWLDDHFMHPLEEVLLGDLLSCFQTPDVNLKTFGSLTEFSNELKISSNIAGIILDFFIFSDSSPDSYECLGQPSIQFNPLSAGTDIASILLGTIKSTGSGSLIESCTPVAVLTNAALNHISEPCRPLFETGRFTICDKQSTSELNAWIEKQIS